MITKIDLFENYEQQTPELAKIVEKWGEEKENNGFDYKDCAQFLKEVNELGFVFDYYLDAEPYFLRPKYIMLDSVGCFVDSETFMTYPQSKSGETNPNEDEATYLPECCGEWFDTLDDKDRETVDILLKFGELEVNSNQTI